ncbi:Clavaminate synthase-like protein, partial [Glycine soja]
MGSSLVEIQVPGQKLVNGVPFPAVVSPPPATASSVPLRDSVKTQKAFLESLFLAAWLTYVNFKYGQPLPSHIVYDCLHILEEESVAIPWQKGDVLLIDNWAVLYSRRSFDPPCQ